MTESMWPETPESKSRLEQITETINLLNEEYAVLAVDRELGMTEVEYLKMQDIRSRIPDLDKETDEDLSEELILANCQLAILVDTSLDEMEAYREEHGEWKDMTK